MRILALLLVSAPVVYTLSYFRAPDTLRECTDTRVSVTLAPGLTPKKDALRGTAPEGSTEIAQTCTRAFADRVALAWCVAEGTLTEDAGTAKVHSETRYYAFEEVGLDDVKMRKCLDEGSSWTSIPRDSRAWRDAKMDYLRREAESQAKALP